MTTRVPMEEQRRAFVWRLLNPHLFLVEIVAIVVDDIFPFNPQQEID